MKKELGNLHGSKEKWVQMKAIHSVVKGFWLYELLQFLLVIFDILFLTDYPELIQVFIEICILTVHLHFMVDISIYVPYLTLLY